MTRRMGPGLTEYVLRTGKPLLADRGMIDGLKQRGEVRSHGTESVTWLGVPLIYDDRTVGVMATQSYDDSHRYDQRDQDILIFVSYHVANALQRKQHADFLREANATLERRVLERRNVGVYPPGTTPSYLTAAVQKKAIVVATKGLKTLTGDDHRSADSGSRGHNHDHDADPHAWQNVANVQTYVANIRDALIAADSAGQSSYQARAEAYLAELAQLDGSIKSVYANIPKAQRTIITHHDAFAYYGKTYGIKFIAPQGVTGDSEPSARDVAALIRQIRKEKAKAVFVENINNGRLIEQIVRDTGAAIGGKLYSDALSAAGGPASTYIDMMRHNTRLMSDALVAANAPAQKPTPGARDAR